MHERRDTERAEDHVEPPLDVLEGRRGHESQGEVAQPAIVVSPLTFHVHVRSMHDSPRRMSSVGEWVSYQLNNVARDTALERMYRGTISEGYIQPIGLSRSQLSPSPSA